MRKIRQDEVDDFAARFCAPAAEARPAAGRPGPSYLPQTPQISYQPPAAPAPKTAERHEDARIVKVPKGEIQPGTSLMPPMPLGTASYTLRLTPKEYKDKKNVIADLEKKGHATVKPIKSGLFSTEAYEIKVPAEYLKLIRQEQAGEQAEQPVEKAAEVPKEPAYPIVVEIDNPAPGLIEKVEKAFPYEVGYTQKEGSNTWVFGMADEEVHASFKRFLIDMGFKDEEAAVPTVVEQSLKIVGDTLKKLEQAAPISEMDKQNEWGAPAQLPGEKPQDYVNRVTGKNQAEEKDGV